MSDEVKTVEEIAQDYTAMGHSVDLINGIIDGSQMADEEAADRQSAVDRNVEHLELMVAKDYWTTEDMTAVNAAITAGKALQNIQGINQKQNNLRVEFSHNEILLKHYLDILKSNLPEEVKEEKTKDK
jgi:hypothetical protein